MKPPKQDFKKVKEKMEQIIGDFREHIESFHIKDFFKNKNGESFNYIKEVKEADEYVIIRLKGTVDAHTISKVKTERRREIKKILDKHILLDFREVTHMDSAALASLLMLLSDLKKHNRKLGIVNITSLLKNYLNIHKLESAVQIYKDENAALRELMKCEVKNRKQK